MSVEEYLNARASYANQLTAIRQLGTEMIRVGGALNRNPLKFIFANSNVGLPMEASMSGESVSVDMGVWLTPLQIMQQLATLHQSKGELENAWQAIPHHQRDGIKSPDELFR